MNLDEARRILNDSGFYAIPRSTWEEIQQKGTSMAMTSDDLDKRFDYHPPSTDEVRDAHEAVRRAAKALAYNITVLVPSGREQSLALTHCEDAMMWANAGIARNQ